MSIGYFPSIYEDELLYSVFARYYQHTGHITYGYVAEELFGDSKVIPSVEFINSLKPEVLQLLLKNMTMQELIKNYTMFPYYARFIPTTKKKRALEALINMRGDYNNLLSIPKSKNGAERYLRYCPICSEKDKKQYGETYWHRSHQITELNVCYKHKCSLVESNVLISGKASRALVSAEKEVNIDNIKLIENDLEIRLAEYVTKVFKADMNIDKDIEIGKFFHYKLEGTKYLSARGKQRNISLLYNDFIKYYKKISVKGIKELWQLQKIFTNYRFNLFEICQLAMFLKVPVSDVVNMKLPAKSQEQLFDEQVKNMRDDGIGCNKIARELGVSSRTIRLVSKGAKREKRIYSSKKINTIDWGKLDKKTFPKVKKIISEIYGTGINRPHKVTEYAVCKKMNLPDKRFDYLPLCRKEIQKYKESNEQYWARELIWAINTIKKNGETINLRHIRDLTNMRKEYLIACMPELEKIADGDIIKIVKQILL
ncbi:MAG: TniQ family protein [Clostridium butyricum]